MTSSAGAQTPSQAGTASEISNPNTDSTTESTAAVDDDREIRSGSYILNSPDFLPGSH